MVELVDATYHERSAVTRLCDILKDENASRGSKFTKQPNVQYTEDYTIMFNCQVNLGDTKHQGLKCVCPTKSERHQSGRVAQGDCSDTHVDTSAAQYDIRSACPVLFPASCPRPR